MTDMLKAALGACWLTRWFAIRRRLDLPLRIVRDCIYCFLSGVGRYDLSWRFYGLPFIRINGKGSRLVLGKRFIASSCIERNAIGIIQRTVIKTHAQGAVIEIGDYTGISGGTIAAWKSIKIGSHVLIGSGAMIIDSDSHPLNWEERRKGGSHEARPIVIEDDVFIGARAIILKGVTIGRGAIIGAGAVVSSDVPAWSVVVGNPARVVKTNNQPPTTNNHK